MKLPEGTPAELIGGELLMSPSPRQRHQVVVGNLFATLREFAEPRRLGRVYIAPFDVHLPSGDIVQPDVIFVAAENAGIVRDWIFGAPDLVVEAVSPESAARDRIVKRDLYARNGVREYWMIDLEARSVEIVGPDGPIGFYEADDAVASPQLAGLSLPVRALFA